MRYVKQYHEVNIEIERAVLDSGDIAQVSRRFHPEHNRLYGYSLEEQGTPIELINLRLLSIGITDKPRFLQEEYHGEDPSHALKKQRQVYLPSKKDFVLTSVYDGHKLRHGNRIDGPAVIEQVNTTTFVTPEYNAVCDKYGSYTVFLKNKEDEIRDRLDLRKS